jgi:twitching motility protein PilT
MAELDRLLNMMLEEGASDLHISSTYPPFLRIRGHMIRLKIPALSPEKCQKYITETMTSEQQTNFEQKLELDWSYQITPEKRFRANAFKHQNGVGAVYRIITDKIKSFKDLLLPESIQSMADIPKGLVLVTGPTGSGKSTTLAALIHHINVTRKQHIITIEDPIEYLHKGHNCLINQREVSKHTYSFANALRSALREDPDVIMVGELRDLETMSLALTAAETGHLVFATLHTSSAHKSVDRIIDSFPADQQSQIRVMLAESLEGVIAQTLLPKADQTGMVPVLEVLVSNSAVKNLIRENKTYQIPSVIQTSSIKGMISFEKSIQSLVSSGVINPTTASTYLPSLKP